MSLFLSYHFLLMKSSVPPPAFSLPASELAFYFINETETLRRELLVKRAFMNFPSGTVDKNPPDNAGNMGLIPGPGRFHMLQVTKPVRLEPVLCNKRRHCSEKSIHHN